MPHSRACSHLFMYIFHAAFHITVAVYLLSSNLSNWRFFVVVVWSFVVVVVWFFHFGEKIWKSSSFALPVDLFPNDKNGVSIHNQAIIRRPGLNIVTFVLHLVNRKRKRNLSQIKSWTHRITYAWAEVKTTVNIYILHRMHLPTNVKTVATHMDRGVI